MPKAVALYLRLSQEDIEVRRNAVREESNSISAQRSLITRYIEESPELCGLSRMEFCDDGFSGTNFSRPDFQKMLALIKQGEIGCVVVKDLSRFGRDYLEVGDYLEHIFPFLGVRFISVNDHYDSANHDGKTVGMDITFRNLVYDYYSKDLSTKVKTAMHIKQQKGRFVTCTPYGYTTLPHRKHTMVIDEPAAAIVREIFDAVLAGKSTREVATALNARGVPTPNEYKGVRRREKTKPQWTHPRISNMIRNIKYTGVMTNHTRESRFIRDKSQRRVPQEQWVVTPDAHPAIIPREKWERANAMLRQPKRVKRTALPQADRVYFCAHCGRKLRKTYGADQYYSCASALYQQDSRCAEIRLKRSEVELIIMQALQVQLSLMKQKQAADKKKQRNPSVSCYQAIAQIEKEIAQLKSKKMERYEAYRAGEISREAFVCTKDQITLQIAEQNEKRVHKEREYQALLQSKVSEMEKSDDILQIERIFSDCDTGFNETMYQAIERIIVTTNEQIEIKWAFADVFG